MKSLNLVLVPVLAVLCAGCNDGTAERPEKPRIAAIIPGDPVVNAPTVAISKRPEKRQIRALMPGDSVRVRLLAGVNARIDGTPYPVLFKLVGDVIGWDGKSVALEEARLIAAAQGSLTDSRVLFRLTRLSMRRPNGRRIEFGVDGWVVGEDDIRGMEGVLIDPIGELSGLHQGLAAANTVCHYGVGNARDTGFVKDGKMPAEPAGTELASSAREYVSVIKERLAQLLPVVQVLSNREATAVFSQSLAIPDLPEQLCEEESSVVLHSLD